MIRFFDLFVVGTNAWPHYKDGHTSMNGSSLFVCQATYSYSLFGLHKLIVSSGFYYHHEIIYNFDPLKPDFCIEKLGFTGVYFIFSYLCSKNIDCGTL